MSNATWTLTPAELARTRAKADEINARAEKRSMIGRIEVEIVEEIRTYVYYSPTGGEYVGERTAPDGSVVRVPLLSGGVLAPGTWYEEITFKVRIGGQAPSFGGWEFLAALDATPEGAVIVRPAPGVDDTFDRSGMDRLRCDHCGTNRHRVKTVVVRHVETREVRQVATSCVKDFLGHTVSPAFDSVTSIREELDDAAGWSAPDTAPTEVVLAVAVAAIRGFGGYVSTDTYTGTPTRDVVRAVLWPVGKGDEELARGLDWRAARERAKVVREFILSDRFEGTGSYVENLKALCAEEWADRRHVGYLASAPQALARWEKTETERLAREEKPSTWLGEPKDKVTFTGEITHVSYSTSYFGYSERTSTVYTIRNAETGQVVKWFASSSALGEDTGVTVSITGTVKRHAEWHGVKETYLTRCKLVANAA